MSKAVTVHLTDRTLESFRSNMSTSKRVNQIVDRYLLLAKHYVGVVKPNFTAEEWGALMEAYSRIDRKTVVVFSVRGLLMRSLEHDRDLRRKVGSLPDYLAAWLAEALERSIDLNERKEANV